jgi:hypothetical protein
MQLSGEKIVATMKDAVSSLHTGVANAGSSTPVLNR